VFDTTFFVKKVLEKFFALQAALKRAQAETDDTDSEPTRSPTSPLPTSLTGINLHNTDSLASDVQHGPIHAWFSHKKIRITPNHKAVDTTGFYDEISILLGDNLALTGKIIDQIKYAYTKGHQSINVNLSKHSPEEIQTITAICREMYDYAFVGKFFYQKPEKIVRLTLQNSANIKKFFTGEWLEWYALMVMLEVCQEKGWGFSGARNLSLNFSNDDLHELDLFCLLNGSIPLCIECKSGEFRPFIEKYLTLGKRLGLNKQQFIICVAGLSDTQAAGLTSMYELTFINEQGLRAYLKQLAFNQS